MAETNTIVAYFEDNATASTAIEALHEAGFTSAHLGVAHNAGSSSSTGTAHGAAAKVGEGASSVWGKVKNFFEGESAEPYADERSQGDFATREITPNPADTYGTSDLHQNLGGLSVPEEHSRYFSHRLGGTEGGVVVTVNAATRAPEAQAILSRYGADFGEGASTYDYAAATPAATTGNIQLLGEVLRVHKDRVSRGEVVVRKEVITENQTIEVPVTREELVIERVAASDITGATGTIGQSETIRIPLTEEVASVDKSTVVREEYAVGKKAVEEVRAVGSEVRHEELVVEDETTQKSVR